MTNTTSQWILPAAILASALVAVTEGFAPIIPPRHISAITHHDGPSLAFSTTSIRTNTNTLNSRLNLSSIHQTKLYMSDNPDDNTGIVTKIFISFVLLFFAASLFAPLIDFASTSAPSATDLRLGDSVVTRQDDGNKLKNYQSKFDALSPAKIQEKLTNLPVFYLSANDGTSMLGDKIYLSFNEAETAAKSSDGSVKVTTLDQVMYPLILKRETVMKTTNTTPVEIKNAKESVESDGKSSSYTLIPTTAALNDAKDMTLKEGDIPLFVVERLAFAGNDGKPQVPLFTEKGDAITSYTRLREAGSGKLPEVPAIRTTSLLDVLESMEKGTRPAVGQLQFYGNADDVIKADEIMSQ